MKVISLEDLKKDNKQAAEWLINYDARKKQYELDYQEILQGHQYIENIGGSRSGVGNPTLSKMLQITKLQTTEKWLQTIEDVQRILGDKKLMFLQARREAANLSHSEKGRPAWVGYVQVSYAEKFSKRYHADYMLSERTIKEWWRQMVELTVHIAAKRGCL